MASLRSLFTYSTSLFQPRTPTQPIFNSVRHYLKNFWEYNGPKKGLVQPLPIYQNNPFFSYRGRLKIKIPTRRVSEVRRIRRASYGHLMKTQAGRSKIMGKILQGRDEYAEVGERFN